MEEVLSSAGSGLDVAVSWGLFNKISDGRGEPAGVYNASLSPFRLVSSLSLCLYLIMLCEFWIFPPALKWNVNY